MSNVETPSQYETEAASELFRKLVEASKANSNLLFKHILVIGGERVEILGRILND